MSKINYKKLEKELTFNKKNCWEEWDEKIKNSAFKFCDNYKRFLDNAKTERESIREGIKMAEENGFVDIEKMKNTSLNRVKLGKIPLNPPLKKGEIKKVYAVNHGKNLALVRFGKKSLSEGVKIIMSHIDSPHLDLKVNPLYEDEKLAYFKTHYYGGIKKYHWPTIPLALHGTVVLESGKKVEFTIGEKEDEPVFMITDLLPHLGKEMAKKPISEAIAGEELNILAGSIPVNDKNVKEKVKLAVLEYLHNEYGLKSEDFFSAEILAVPADKARDIGFDRSLISAYGQDDAVCAYTSIIAFMDSKTSDQTQICLWIDKEEIGSEGNTGAQAIFLENFIADLLELSGLESNMKEVYRVLDKSFALSSDVTAGFDPDYKNVHDPLNCAKLGFGMAFEKYTGHGGKYHSSEASAEYVAKLRNILNKNKVIWQTAGLGKVDEGGGGTIAMYLAKRGIEVIDCGVPLFNMHAPLEIASKADIYSAYLGYLAFLG